MDLASYEAQRIASENTGGYIPHPSVMPLQNPGGGPFTSPHAVALFGKPASATADSAAYVGGYSGGSGSGSGMAVAAVIAVAFIGAAVVFAGHDNSTSGTSYGAYPATTNTQPDYSSGASTYTPPSAPVYSDDWQHPQVHAEDGIAYVEMGQNRFLNLAAKPDESMWSWSMTAALTIEDMFNDLNRTSDRLPKGTAYTPEYIGDRQKPEDLVRVRDKDGNEGILVTIKKDDDSVRYLLINATDYDKNYIPASAPAPVDTSADAAPSTADTAPAQDENSTGPAANTDVPAAPAADAPDYTEVPGQIVRKAIVAASTYRGEAVREANFYPYAKQGDDLVSVGETADVGTRNPLPFPLRAHFQVDWCDRGYCEVTAPVKVDWHAARVMIGLIAAKDFTKADPVPPAQSSTSDALAGAPQP